MSKEEFDKLIAKVDASEQIADSIKVAVRTVIEGLNHETQIIPLLVPWNFEVNGEEAHSSVCLTWFRPDSEKSEARELSFYFRDDGTVDAYAFLGNHRSVWRGDADDTFRWMKCQDWFMGIHKIPDWFDAGDLSQWFDAEGAK